jgi:uncharacterized protein YbaR (Trm112 family)
MKRQLLDILACPVCKHHPLELEADSESNGEVLEGKLTCPKCGKLYLIKDGIPDLIPPGQ